MPPANRLHERSTAATCASTTIVSDRVESAGGNAQILGRPEVGGAWQPESFVSAPNGATSETVDVLIESARSLDILRVRADTLEQLREIGSDRGVAEAVPLGARYRSARDPRSLPSEVRWRHEDCPVESGRS